jgi:hypothetical protein
MLTNEEDSREFLKVNLGKIFKFRAVIADFGVRKYDTRKQTLLLTDVTFSHQKVTDHVWVRRPKRKELNVGDIVLVEAKCISYTKKINRRDKVTRYGIQLINLKVLSSPST